MYEPMLAKEYDIKKVKFPVMVQPKLDGIRCLVHVEDGGSFLAFSRNGKPLSLPAHIEEDLRKCIRESELRCPGKVFDGELYGHGLSFQETMSRVKRLSTRHEDILAIKYCIYDLVSEDLFFCQRTAIVQEFTKYGTIGVEGVRTQSCGSETEVELFHSSCVASGYEGSMVRTYSDFYHVGKRSWALMKKKDWQEGDFKIVDILEGEGKNAGTAVFVMEMSPGGPQFKATSPGTYEQKSAAWWDRNKLRGKICSVKYFELTDAGIPRFPEAIGIKEDR